ncbi:unnamed protein product [Rhizoctonia solani]|uniref:Ubiquitin-like protease family profile domain-containing protein n=1 Tax=Rhizoctonia solani TaxID=456999 RepID=A0A8H3CLA1_9AGAM|nr:unnamed protein product [Rhizoctonia solani]
MDSYLEPKLGEHSIGTTPRPKTESTDLKEKAHRLLTIAQAEFGLKMQLKDSPLRDQIHIFDTLFFRRLDAGRGKGCDYHAVKNWTSTLDIFSKQFIIVPIREQGIWYIAIICFPKHILEIDCTEPQPLSTVPSERTSILILDPYERDHSRTIRILREYLLAEALERHEKMVNFIKDMPMFWPVDGKHLSVGLESEWCDGGIHLLHYTRMFFANPLEIIALPPVSSYQTLEP